MINFIENKNNFCVVCVDDVLLFTSYKTKIATFNRKKIILKLNEDKWNYSQTTLKQLKYFVNNYCEAGFYTTKKEFEKKIKKNGFIHLVKEYDL